MSDFNTDNIDKFGLCVFCHRDLITKRVVDGKVIEMFTPDHGHTEFLLNNGSRMQVCMCRTCRESVDLTAPAIQDMIMKAVQKGWELEVRILVADEKHPQWTEGFGKAYLETMSKLNIDTHSDTLDKVRLEERSQVLGKEFNEARISERQIKNTDDVTILQVSEVPSGPDINS